MGAAKLRSTAWENYGVKMTEGEAEWFKKEWRRRNPRIVGFWTEIEGAARDAILHPGRVYPVMPSAITMQATARTLQLRLPSGRKLFYHKPHVGASGEITYWGEEKGAWKQRRTWGGTLAENATQACARDIMAEAMSRVATRLGLSPLMTVHDELVYAADDGAELKKLMLEAPDWAGGLPIAGEAKTGPRYSVW
jgi:DNA polymerase